MTAAVAPIVTALREKYEGSPKWTRYRPKGPVRCDHCMQDYVGKPTTGPLTARMARWSRRTSLMILLCHEHADLWREQDALPPLKRKRDLGGAA